jgi:VIT1/CCC1 family predicted Fe2+/Mn2+ transporter
MKSKRGVAWQYVVSLVVGIIILLILLFIVAKSKGTTGGLIEQLGSWFG